MKIEIDYPEVSVKKLHKYKIRKVLWIIITLLCVASVIVNLAVGGKAWSILVCWSAFSFWKIFMSPDMIEFNLISQTTKPFIYVAGILLVIDIFITPDDAVFIIPIVGFGLLTLAAISFFANTRRRKFAAMPLVWISIFAMIMLALALADVIELTWPVIVFGCEGLGLTLIGFIFFPGTLLSELRKRFHL